MVANKSRFSRYSNEQGTALLDPARGLRGMPPNLGRQVVPHVLTFPSIMHNVARAYRNPDEAIRLSRYNALSMRNDITLMACVKARQRMSALLNWHLVPEDEKSPLQKQLVDDLSAVVTRTKKFMAYRFWLMDAIWRGRSACNNILGWDWINGKQRMIVRNWKPINGDKLAFRFDQFGFPDTAQIGIQVGASAPLDGCTEITNDYGRVRFLQPWERALLTVHQHEIEDADFYDGYSAGAVHGIGIRSQIYATWVLKQEALGQLVDFIDRVGQGFTIYYYDSSNPSSKAEVENIAKNNDGRNAILFPRPLGDDSQVYGVERIEPSSAGIDALRSLVEDFFGDAVLRFIMGATLPMKSEPQGIGGGNSDAHENMVSQVVKFDATNLEETLTSELVEPLKNFNFPEAKNVHVRMVLDVEADEVKDKLDALKQAFDMGLKIPASQVAEMVGVGKATDDEEVLQNPQFQQQGMGMPGMGGQPGQPGTQVQAQGWSPEQDGADANFGETDEEQPEEVPGVEQYDKAEPSDSLPAGAARLVKARVRSIQPSQDDVVSWNGQVISIPQDAPKDALLHALAHAIDDVSDEQAWQGVWQKELAQGGLSNYATVSPAEGFAEFGRLAWSNPKTAEKYFPQCFRVWQDQGLVEGKPDAQPARALGDPNVRYALEIAERALLRNGQQAKEPEIDRTSKFARVRDSIRYSEQGADPEHERMVLAHKVATGELAKFGSPKSQDQRKEIIQRVARAVAEALGCRPKQALTDYIDPQFWNDLKVVA